MKQVIALLVGAILILVAWWIFGSAAPGPSYALLEVPEESANPRELLRGAHQLWKAEAGHYDPAQVTAFLGLLTEKLDDAAFSLVTAPALHAWKNHRPVSSVKGSLQALQERLLPRLAALGALEELEGLVRIAAEKASDHAAVDRALDDSVRGALDRFEGSRRALLVGACIRAGEFARGGKLLKEISWAPTAAAGEQVPAARAAAGVELLAKAKGKAWDPAALVREWVAQDEDFFGASCLRPSFEGLVFDVLRTDIRPVGLPPVAGLVQGSLALPGADRFWSRIARAFAGHLVQAAPVKTRNLAELLGALPAAPGLAYSVWMRAADLTEAAAPEDPLRTAEYLRRALEATCSESERVEATQRLAALLTTRLELAEARKRLEDALALVQKPALRRELETRLQQTKALQAQDAARVAQEMKNLKMERQRGNLDLLREQIKIKRKIQAPPAELEALERELRRLEKELPE